MNVCCVYMYFGQSHTEEDVIFHFFLLSTLVFKIGSLSEI